LAKRRRVMKIAVTIGLDLGKSVFQVHGVDDGGAVVVQRRLTRSKLLAFFARQGPSLVGMEASAAVTIGEESSGSWDTGYD
jgi:transposase